MTYAADVATIAASGGVWFCHHSVGDNLITGIGELGVGDLTITSTTDPDDMGPGILAHIGNLGSNGDPTGKLSAFDTAMRTGGIGTKLSASSGCAVLKFCFVDFADEIPSGFLDALDSTIAALIADYPSVKFALCTVPLQATDATKNGRRETVSDHIRAMSGIGVIEVAVPESTETDGVTRHYYNAVPALFDDYDADYGHLNATGRQYVTPTFVADLAEFISEESEPMASTIPFFHKSEALTGGSKGTPMIMLLSACTVATTMSNVSLLLAAGTELVGTNYTRLPLASFAVSTFATGSVAYTASDPTWTALSGSTTPSICFYACYWDGGAETLRTIFAIGDNTDVSPNNNDFTLKFSTNGGVISGWGAL